MHKKSHLSSIRLKKNLRLKGVLILFFIFASIFPIFVNNLDDKIIKFAEEDYGARHRHSGHQKAHRIEMKTGGAAVSFLLFSHQSPFAYFPGSCAPFKRKDPG